MGLTLDSTEEESNASAHSARDSVSSNSTLNATDHELVAGGCVHFILFGGRVLTGNYFNRTKSSSGVSAICKCITFGRVMHGMSNCGEDEVPRDS